MVLEDAAGFELQVASRRDGFAQLRSGLHYIEPIPNRYFSEVMNIYTEIKWQSHA